MYNIETKGEKKYFFGTGKVKKDATPVREYPGGTLSGTTIVVKNSYGQDKTFQITAFNEKAQFFSDTVKKDMVIAVQGVYTIKDETDGRKQHRVGIDSYELVLEGIIVSNESKNKNKSNTDGPSAQESNDSSNEEQTQTFSKDEGMSGNIVEMNNADIEDIEEDDDDIPF